MPIHFHLDFTRLEKIHQLTNRPSAGAGWGWVIASWFFALVARFISLPVGLSISRCILASDRTRATFPVTSNPN